MALIGNYIDKEEYYVTKVVLFYAIVFIQGFANETFQFTLGRYVSCFGYKPLAEFNAGTSLSSIIVSAISCIIQFTGSSDSWKLIWN